MFTEKAKKNADACRFCWMCRHVCPVGLVTGKEGNNARAKGLLVSMDERNIPLASDSMNIMYECCLCKACTNDCVTGYDPSIYILEARTNAVVDDMVPENVKKVIARAITGSMYETAPDKDLAARIKKLPKKAEVVLYLGENARRSAAFIANAYMDLLSKAKVDYTVTSDEPESGAQLGELIGYVDEVRQKAKHCMERLAQTEAKTVVVLNPTDCAFMKHNCAEWGILLQAKVITATEFADQLIQSGKLSPKNLNRKAAYHDPCRLARDLDETETARRIIASMGIELNELFLNRKLTKCCGGAVLKETYPDIAAKTIKGRWNDVAMALETTLITACPCCYSMLSRDIPEGMKIEDIFTLLNNAC